MLSPPPPAHADAGAPARVVADTMPTSSPTGSGHLAGVWMATTLLLMAAAREGERPTPIEAATPTR